jgi:hypothetical protein
MRRDTYASNSLSGISRKVQIVFQEYIRKNMLQIVFHEYLVKFTSNRVARNEEEEYASNSLSGISRKVYFKEAFRNTSGRICFK